MASSEEIGDLLVCSVCHEVIHNCLSIHPCLHNYCSGCLLQWMQRSEECPQCRMKITSTAVNRTINGIVDAYLKDHPEKVREISDLRELDRAAEECSTARSTTNGSRERENRPEADRNRSRRRRSDRSDQSDHRHERRRSRSRQRRRSRSRSSRRSRSRSYSRLHNRSPEQAHTRVVSRGRVRSRSVSRTQSSSSSFDRSPVVGTVSPLNASLSPSSDSADSSSSPHVSTRSERSSSLSSTSDSSSSSSSRRSHGRPIRCTIYLEPPSRSNNR